MGEVAREVIAADAQRRGELRRVAVVADELGGLGPQVDQDHAFAALFGEHGRVAGGDGFVDGFIHREVGAIDGADEVGVFLGGDGDQKRVGFDGGGHHAAGIVKAGVIVNHEVLREKLEDHTIFLHLDAHGAVHGAVDVALFDFAGAAELHAATDWYYLIGGLVGVVFGTRYFLKTKTGNELWNRWQLKLPIFGAAHPQDQR